MNNFYAFGMDMPGRKTEPIDNYKYSFNGKLDDKSDGWQTQDYGYRTYDYRLGRFISQDPLREDFAYLTPYQFASNSPVSNIDLDGLEAIRPEGMELVPEGGPYGQRGQDWDVVTSTAAEINIARDNNWIGTSGKLYYSETVFPTNSSFNGKGGYTIWQKKTRVLTCTTIKSKTNTVRNIVVMNKIPQKPLKKEATANSFLVGIYPWDYTSDQHEDMILAQLQRIKNEESSITKEKGVVDEIVFHINPDYTLSDYNRLKNQIQISFPKANIVDKVYPNGFYPSAGGKTAMLFGIDINYHVDQKDKVNTHIEQQVETNDCEETECKEETKQ